MTDSERSAPRDVLQSAQKDGLEYGAASPAGPLSVMQEWEQPGREEHCTGTVGGNPEKHREDEAERPGSSVEGDGATGPRQDAGQAASKEFNQSLARLEMNSLEVKLFLDSIDQRISRMEPRLEGIRGAETDAGRTDVTSPAGVSEAVLGEPAAELHADVPDAPMPAPPGPTAERRRRAQGVPVERRREPRAVAVEEYEKEPWDFDAAKAFLRRRWIPVAAVACLTLMIVVLLVGSGHQAEPPMGAVTTTEAGPVMASAAPSRGAKRSADVPWGTRAGTEASRPAGAAERMAPAHDGGTGRPIVEQGVRAPQQLVAGPVPTIPAPTAPAPAAAMPSGTGTAAPATVVTAAIVPPTSDHAVGDAALTSVPGTSREDAGPQPGAANGAASGRIIPPAYKRVNVSSGVMAGNLLYSPRPAYPKGIVGLFHPQGEVVLQAIISKRGRVANLKVISGHYMLRGAAKDAVRTWRYRPYVINGTPVEVATIVSVEFYK